MTEVLEEIGSLAKNGYREVVLTGIHLSSYGVEKGNDFTSGKLLQLIQEVQKIHGIDRIRLGSLEPRIITEEFVKGIVQCSKLCPHFHLSLQSGCDTVLKRMNRKYLTEEYYEKVCILRKYFDHPAITTDVIVGFPGETQEEFEATKEFLRKTGFYEMHIFKYSRRKGTPAAAMKDQISEDIKALRSNELLQLEKEMSQKYREAFLHKTVEVLFEEKKVVEGRNCQIGYTKEYIRAAFETNENLSGQVHSGKLTKLSDSDILLFKP